MTDVEPSAPRIAIALLAVAAVAVAAAGVPFDYQGDGVGESETPIPTSTPEASETPQPRGPGIFLFGWLASAVRYLFAGAFGVLAIAAAVVIYRSLWRAAPPESDPEFDRDDESAGHVSGDLDPIADAAGRAADRIQHGETLDNEVYRAWKEMTDHLGVANRRARTAGEFATAAVRAGMDPDDVRELTRLFETVCYGDTEPSSTEERRALDLLRRIESKHGGDRE